MQCNEIFGKIFQLDLNAKCFAKQIRSNKQRTQIYRNINCGNVFKRGAAKTNCKWSLNSWAARQTKRFSIISGRLLLRGRAGMGQQEKKSELCAVTVTDKWIFGSFLPSSPALNSAEQWKDCCAVICRPVRSAWLKGPDSPQSPGDPWGQNKAEQGQNTMPNMFS